MRQTSQDLHTFSDKPRPAERDRREDPRAPTAPAVPLEPEWVELTELATD